MIKELKASQDLLFASIQQSDNLMGTEKTMPVNKPDDLAIAFGKLNGSNRRITVEAGKAMGLHPFSLSDDGTVLKRLNLALTDNFVDFG